jgi:hypothetical protein
MNLLDYLRPIQQPLEERDPVRVQINEYTEISKHDVMDRAKLPPIDGIAVESTESPSEAHDGPYLIGTMIGALLAIAIATSFFLRPVSSLANDIFPFALAIPVATLAALYCLVATFNARLKNRVEPQFGGLVASLLSLPLLGFYSLPPGSAFRTALSVLVIGLVGMVADKMTGHMIFFYTANIRLPYEDVKRRRAWWKGRFAIRSSSRDGLSPKTLSDHVWGFVVAAAYVFMPRTDLHWPMFLIPPALALAWAYRRPKEMPAVKDFVPLVLLPAFKSWMCWGRWEGPDGSKTPGVFASPAGSSKKRLFLTWLSLWACASAFVPPVLSWWRTPDGLSRGFWTSLFRSTSYLVLPLLVVLTTFTAVGGAALGAAYQQIEAPGAEATAARRLWTDWRCYTTKLGESENTLAREHHFLGIHREARYPIFVHDSLFDVPTHIVGPTGSGKTARAVTPILSQIIARGDPVVVIDLKQDLALLAETMATGLEFGRTVKYFTNQLGHATYAFNPYHEANQDSVSFSQVVENQLEALGVAHGEGYGKGYFSGILRMRLLETVKANPEINTYVQLYTKLADDTSGNRRERQDCLELINKLRQMADVQALNWTRRPGSDPVADNAIFMPDVLEHNQIAYFNLPAIGETSTVRAIACLVVNAVMNAAKAYTDKSGKPKRVVVVLDEFQRAASASFLLVQQQGRAFGLSMILANQNLADLDLKEAPGLLQSTINNSATHIYFSPAEPTLEDMLIDQSGHSRYEPEATVEDPMTEKWPLEPVAKLPSIIDKRYNRTDLKAYSSQPDVGLVQFRQNVGYTCFGGHLFAVEFGFHISKEVFKERSCTPWPAGNEMTLVARRRPEGKQSSAPSAEATQILTAQQGRRGDAKVERLGGHSKNAEHGPSSVWRERLEKAYLKRSRQEETTDAK